MVYRRLAPITIFNKLTSRQHNAMLEFGYKPIFLVSRLDALELSTIQIQLEEDIDNDVTAQKLIWGRSRIKNRNAIPAKGIDHVFLGHTPLENIVTLGNCHFIDTAAVFGHKLTVLNISDFLKDK